MRVRIIYRLALLFLGGSFCVDEFSALRFFLEHGHWWKVAFYTVARRVDDDVFCFDSWAFEDDNVLCDLPEGRDRPAVFAVNFFDVFDRLV